MIFHEGGLAGSVFADEADELSLSDFERRAAQYRRAPPDESVCSEALCDIVHDQRRVAGRSVPVS